MSTIGFSEVGPPNCDGSFRKTLVRAMPRVGSSMFFGAPVISRPPSLRPLSEPAFWISLFLKTQRTTPFWITSCSLLTGKVATARPEMTSYLRSRPAPRRLTRTSLPSTGSITSPLTLTGSLERYCVPWSTSYLRRHGEVTTTRSNFTNDWHSGSSLISRIATMSVAPSSSVTRTRRFARLSSRIVVVSLGLVPVSSS